MSTKRALISVSDKSGIVDLARGLVEAGYEIVSSGGTASELAAAGIPVTKVADVTGAPEILGGRVKTLHPKIHGGILADRRKQEHVAELEEQGIVPIDLVVCNLYPFERTVADPEVAEDDAIEQIDIGGPAMVRARGEELPLGRDRRESRAATRSSWTRSRRRARSRWRRVAGCPWRRSSTPPRTTPRSRTTSDEQDWPDSS